MRTWTDGIPSKAKLLFLIAWGRLALVAGPAVGQGNGNQILAVTPGSAAQGTNGLVVTFTLDTDIPPPPPTDRLPTNVSLGSMVGTSVAHPVSNIVTAVFNIPIAYPTGAVTATVAFEAPAPTFSKTAAFTVTPGPGVQAGFTGSPLFGLPPLTVIFTNTSAGTITGQFWNFGDGTTSTNTSPVHVYSNAASYSVSLAVYGSSATSTLTRSSYVTVTTNTGAYAVVDTGQTRCYNETTNIAAPSAGQPFYGQDAQCAGLQPAFTLSGDGKTVYDRNTGLTWQRTPDITGDGLINTNDKLSWAAAQLRPAALNATNYGGFSDWRLPTIKELYSLIDFRGTDPSGLSGSDTSGLTPFIDTNYFKFAYGDTAHGERIIDSQYASSSLYVSTASEQLLFGVNFADGRIKGYGLTLNGADKTFFVQCVRGNTAYGKNLFSDNGDQTVTDKATGLMWMKGDSGAGMNWLNALAWAQARNAEKYLGHGDWRLPNAKELQSILDYSRSPDTSGSAAIDPVFTCTRITNENNQVDYPWYWSGTTHAAYSGSGSSGAYVCFGRGLGYMNSVWVDVHGAGCQRSDPKGGSLSNYSFAVNGYYNSIAPQGDAIRIFNYVRLVRDYPPDADSVGDGIPDWWRAQYFGGTGMTTNSQSCASCDADGDGLSNLDEYGADTNPRTNTSSLAVLRIVAGTNDVSLQWIGGSIAWQRLEYCSDLASNQWTGILTNAPPTSATNSAVIGAPPATNAFYRIKAWR